MRLFRRKKWPECPECGRPVALQSGVVGAEETLWVCLSCDTGGWISDDGRLVLTMKHGIYTGRRPPSTDAMTEDIQRMKGE